MRPLAHRMPGPTRTWPCTSTAFLTTQRLERRTCRQAAVPKRCHSGFGCRVLRPLRFSFRCGVTGSQGWCLGFRDGGLSAWNVYGDPTVAFYGMYASVPEMPPLQTWHHVAYVYDGDHNASLYLDGALAVATTADPSGRTPLSVWIGSLDGLSAFYAGDMDEYPHLGCRPDCSGYHRRNARTCPRRCTGLGGVLYVRWRGWNTRTRQLRQRERHDPGRRRSFADADICSVDRSLRRLSSAPWEFG